MKIEQKGIYWANLNPTKGSEQSGKRPAVVISGDVMNDNLPICIICPITSNIKNYPTSIFLEKNQINNLKKDSEILTFQIRTITNKRLIKKIGEISAEKLKLTISNLNDILKF